MASFTAKLGTIDLAQYVRVAPGEGLDPANSGYLEPAFADSPLRGGGPLINLDARNREITLPVAFNAASKDALFTLIQSVNIESLKQNLQFEWKDQGASNSTFFDVQSVRVDIDYNFRRAQKFWCFATVHIWCAPFGHTGTTRVLATTTSSGMVQAPLVPTVPAGDVDAAAQWTVTGGSTVSVDQYGRFVGIAALPASYLHRWLAPSIGMGSVVISTFPTYVGASGADGSQYCWPLTNAASALDIAGQINIPNTYGQYAGRNRIYAVGRSTGEPVNGMWAQDWEGNRIGATAIASGIRDWHLYDLGVMNVPTLGAPSQLQVTLRSKPLTSASYWGHTPYGTYRSNLTDGAIQINEIIVLPESDHALLVDDVDVPSQIVYDTFFTGAPVGSEPQLIGHTSESGHTWATSLQGFAPSNVLYLRQFLHGFITLATVGASFMYAARIPSIQLSELRCETRFIGGNARPSQVEGYLGLRKEYTSIATGGFYEVRTGFAGGVGPTNAYLSVFSQNASGATTLASQQISIIGTFSGEAGRMCKLIGEFGQDYVRGCLLHEDPLAPTPVLGSIIASGALVNVFGFNPGVIVGDPALSLHMASVQVNDTNGPYHAQPADFRITSVPTQRVRPRDVYVFDGVGGEAYRRPLNGDIQQRLTHKLRGAIPPVPVVPTTARLVAFSIGLPEGTAGDITDVSVAVREQFRFAR